MLVLFSLFFVLPSFEAAFTQTDTNCSMAGAYTPSAVGCENVYSPAACAITYPVGTALPSAGGTDDRPGQCFTTSGTVTDPISQDVKDMAVATCPLQCGYCCQTLAYTCANAPYPRINCGTVTRTMCRDPNWRSIIASDCPNTCGFCLLGGCIDAAPDCATQPSVCVTRGLESFVATYCQRTCGLCSSSSTTSSSATTSSGSTTCGNNNVNCANWVRNGFCTSTFYSAAQKRSYCGTSCGLCTGK